LQYKQNKSLFIKRFLNFKKMKKLCMLLLASVLVTSSCAKKNDLEPVIKFKTTEGTIKVRLYAETPKHRDNFVKLVEAGFYEGVLFHRVIADFMIQAGDPDSKNANLKASLGSGDVGYSIPAEFVYPKYYHKKGALAAAREGDDTNPAKASSGCQFYIVKGKVFTNAELNALEQKRSMKFTNEQRNDYTTIGGTPHLDGNYTVFGEVIEGLEIVTNISRVKTGELDRPLENVRILKAKRIE
jgi:cyclophilin family peptidyl-prolyl cis-trans isomerase